MFLNSKALLLEKQFYSIAAQHSRLTACNNTLEENTGAVVLARAYMRAC